MTYIQNEQKLIKEQILLKKDIVLVKRLVIIVLDPRTQKQYKGAKEETVMEKGDRKELSQEIPVVDMKKFNLTNTRSPI